MSKGYDFSEVDSSRYEPISDAFIPENNYFYKGEIRSYVDLQNACKIIYKKLLELNISKKKRKSIENAFYHLGSTIVSSISKEERGVHPEKLCLIIKNGKVYIQSSLEFELS